MAKLLNKKEVPYADGCFTWETEYKDIFVTDYDWQADKDLRKENKLMLFFVGDVNGERWAFFSYISKKVSDNEELLEWAINEFKKANKI